MNEIDSLLQEIWSDDRVDHHEKKLIKRLARSESAENAFDYDYVRRACFKIAEQKISSGSNATLILKSLEKINKIINRAQLSTLGDEIDVCFSPGEVCRNKIISLLKSAQQQIDICVFTISDNKITKEIIAAHERGVAVRVISDNDKSNDKGSDIHFMMKNKVPLRMDKSTFHMHHKFAIIDDRLINGSFNWTKSATDKNQENITVSNSQILIKKFSGKFDALWASYEV